MFKYVEEWLKGIGVILLVGGIIASTVAFINISENVSESYGITVLVAGILSSIASSVLFYGVGESVGLNKQILQELKEQNTEKWRDMGMAFQKKKTDENESEQEDANLVREDIINKMQQYEETNKRFCSACGTKIKTGATKCYRCGNDI